MTLAIYRTESVGTPGLGYPLLLRLGKGLVVIFNYIQAAGPLRSEVLFSRQQSGPIPRLGKVRSRHVSRERQALKCKQLGLRTSGGVRTPRSPGPLMRSWTTCIVTGPLSEEEVDALPRGGPEPTHAYKHKAAWSPY